MKVCIDAGHGGSDPGAVGENPFELQEKVFNLNVALLLEEVLEQRGHDVIMTRRMDRTLSLDARARFANRNDADLFISIHANSASGTSAEGMEVFHFEGSVQGAAAAHRALDSMLATFPGHRDRGVKTANLAVLRLTLMPAILVECEFLNNPTQLQFLADPNNQAGLAQAIAAAVPSDSD